MFYLYFTVYFNFMNYSLCGKEILSSYIKYYNLEVIESFLHLFLTSRNILIRTQDTPSIRSLNNYLDKYTMYVLLANSFRIVYHVKCTASTLCYIGFSWCIELYTFR